MTYLPTLDNTPAQERGPLARRWMDEELLPFYAELRRERPILTLPYPWR